LNVYISKLTHHSKTTYIIVSSQLYSLLTNNISCVSWRVIQHHRFPDKNQELSDQQHWHLEPAQSQNLNTIRPLSDTVPLWSGSSYRAFVYIGNDGFCFAADCKHNNHKDKCRFFWFPSNSKEFKKWEHLSRLNSLTYTNVIANVNKKATNRTVSFDKWAMCHLTAV